MLNKIKKENSKKSVKYPNISQYYNQNIPIPNYIGKIIKLSSENKKIPLNIHGNLEDILSNNSFEIYIDENKQNVSIVSIKFKFCSNTTPFTFLVQSIDHEILNQTEFYDKSASSDNVSIIKCMTYIPAKTPKFNSEENYIFSLNPNDVRDKVKKLIDIKNVITETKLYYDNYNPPKNLQEPQTSDQYLDVIINLANNIDILALKKNIKVYTTNIGEEMFEISDRKNKKYFDFLNMTFAENKLSLYETWKDEKIKMHQTYSKNVYDKSIKLIENIKKAIGIYQKLTISLKPMFKVDDRDAYIKEMNRKKKIYGNVFLELMINYNVFEKK